MRVITRRRERLLLAELAEVRTERHLRQRTDEPPNLGLVNYEMGLRTAGNILGVLEWGGLRPQRRLHRFYRIERGASRWATWKARWWR